MSTPRQPFDDPSDRVDEVAADAAEHDRLDPPLSAAELARRFHELTGDRLVVHPFSEELEGLIPRVAYLALRDFWGETPVPPALEKKYGKFEIAVYESRVPARKREGETDDRGIRWERLLNELSPQPHYVGAFKVYEPNVLLRWYPESRRFETNEQWQRLDAALSAIVGARQE